MSPKSRVDHLLVEQGYFSSRTQAKNAILAGKIRVGADHLVRKSSECFDYNTEFNVIAECPYVSRGALKLKPGLDRYNPDLSRAIALDVGASTGGFTDIMLQYGADRVYAVDVGYGQLHQRLRVDPRVRCLERTNARYLTGEDIPEPIDIVTVDLAFISVTKVLPTVAQLLAPGAWAFILIKPQFEASRSEIAKGGVVKDADVIDRVVGDICSFCTKQLHWRHLDVIPSPIKGPKGNQEQLAIFRTPGLPGEAIN